MTTAYESRFDAAEADVDSGSPWMFREADTPNPLTIEVTGWSTGHTKLGEAEFMNGVDRAGQKWSVLVGNAVLTKTLIEGLVEEWDSATNGYVVKATLGRVKRGEVVSLKFTGDAESAAGYVYPTFKVSRIPAPAATEDTKGELPEDY